MSLTHGPILFNLDAHGVTLWVRADGPGTVHACYGPSGVDPLETTPPVELVAGSDYTAALRIDGLMPSTAYVAEVNLDGIPGGTHAFTTVSADEDQAEITVAFISDTFRAYPAPALATVRGLWPLGVCIIGDNDHLNYLANTSTPTGALAKARDSHRALRDESTDFGLDFLEHVVSAGLPILGHIPDDHDTGKDNMSSTSTRYWPQVLQAMREYWPPPADHGFDTGYLYSAIRLGGTRLFFLDTRTHRESPGAHRPLLGAGQWAWLEAGFAAASADPTTRQVVLVSPVPVNPGCPKLDAWHGYADERARLFALAATYPRVLVVSGDCHFGSIVLPPRSPLAEMNIPQCNPGFSNTCNNQPAQWTLNSAAAGTGFGTLTLRPEEAVMTIYNADGTMRFTVTV